MVVRSDGSGATAQFTLWLLRQYPADYAKLCAVTGCDPQHATSFFPDRRGLKNFVAQNGSQGVTTYSANNQFTINYDEYSYAQGIGFPVAQVKNAAGFYTLPTESRRRRRADPGEHQPGQEVSELPLPGPLQGLRLQGPPHVSHVCVLVHDCPDPGHQCPEPGAGSHAGLLRELRPVRGPAPHGPTRILAAAHEPGPGRDGTDPQNTGRGPGHVAKMDQTRDSVSGGSAPACNNPTFKPGDSPSANQLVRSAPFDKACDAACQVPWRGADAAVNQGPAGAPAAAGPEAAAGPAEVTDLADAGAAAVDPASEAAACDPDSGTCTAVAAGAASGVAGQLTPVTTTLASSRGWGQPQNLLLIIGGLVGLLVLVPPLTAGALARRAGSKRGTKA